MSSACRGSNGAIPPAGDGVVAMGGAPGAPPGPQAPPMPPSRPQAPHAPRPPGPAWRPRPRLAPHAPGPPTQAPVARVPRCFPWYFKHSPEIAFDPYILGRLVANGH